MLNPTYLTLSRHNVFYFRWPLPKNLRQTGKTTHLKLSLRTREPKQALQLANALEYHVRALFQRGYGVGMQFDEMKQRVETYFQDLWEYEKAKIDKNGPFSPEETERHQKLLARNMELHSFNQFRNDLNIAIPKEPDYQLRPLRELTGIKPNSDDPDYVMLTELYRHGAIAYFQSLLHYSQEKVRFSFAPANQPPVDFMRSEVQDEETLSHIIDKFKAEVMAANLWSKKAADERAEFYALLTEVIGANTPSKTVTIAHARKVKDLLIKLPKNRKKMKATRHLTLAEQISLDNVETLSVTSINTYLQSYSSLFSWAVKNGYAEKNPFHGMALKSSKQKKRDQFTADHVKTMLSSLQAKKAKNEIADHAYWGTLIAIYTGARLNEIASLTPDDIREENGIWYFDINDQDEMKRLKTNAATRRVPVHSALLTLGILEYREMVKDKNAPNIRLLHNLSYSEKEGWGRNLGRWFNTTFLEFLEIKKPGLSFHSLRHTAITTMRRTDIERPIVQSIVGHEPDGVTEEVYTHGYELSQLQTAIETLKF